MLTSAYHVLYAGWTHRIVMSGYFQGKCDPEKRRENAPARPEHLICMLRNNCTTEHWMQMRPEAVQRSSFSLKPVEPACISESESRLLCEGTVKKGWSPLTSSQTHARAGQGAGKGGARLHRGVMSSSRGMKKG